MIKTFIADITPLFSEEIYNHYYNRASRERQEKADKLHDEIKKCQSIGVYSLHQIVLSETGLSTEHPFNYSHSGKYVVCSISSEKDIKVGCDIEVYGDIDIKLAKRYYCQREYEYVLSGKDTADYAWRFFRIWVLKESFMKAVRRGLGLSTKKFEISFDKSDKPRLIVKPGEYTDDYFYKEYKILDDVFIAACATEDRFSEIVKIDLRDTHILHRGCKDEAKNKMV